MKISEMLQAKKMGADKVVKIAKVANEVKDFFSKVFDFGSKISAAKKAWAAATATKGLDNGVFSHRGYGKPEFNISIAIPQPKTQPTLAGAGLRL